jgi:ubiquinone/menaquinone biosynthesis C-methylase UbiE
MSNASAPSPGHPTISAVIEMSPEARKQAVAGLFTRTADTYDSVLPFFTHFGEMTVTAAALAPGEHVLDVACGLGASVFPAAKAVGPSGHVTGVDLAPGMIEALQQRIRVGSLTNADAQVMDAEVLEFPAGGFDAVICAFGIMFLPNIPQALSEIRRVLRPNGCAAVAVWAGATPNLGFLGELSAEFGGVNFESGPGPPPPWNDDAGFSALLEQAGFSSVRVVSEEASFELRDADTWWRWQLSHGARVYWDMMPDEKREAFRGAAIARYAELADDAGRSVFVQRARIAVGRS